MDQTENTQNSDISLIDLTADIVAAYVGNNSVNAAELGTLISSVHGALNGLVNKPAQAQAEPPKPAVPIKKSVTPDHIISLEDGKPYKSLKRHLKRFGLTPQQYREKWGLPADYPMVAANYSEKRSELAKKLGLGQARKQAAAPAPAPAPAKRGGRRKAAA